MRDIVHRLCEVGWLFRKVRTFVDSRAHDKSVGLVCQVHSGVHTLRIIMLFYEIRISVDIRDIRS